MCPLTNARQATKLTIFTGDDEGVDRAGGDDVQPEVLHTNLNITGRAVLVGEAIKVGVEEAGV